MEINTFRLTTDVRLEQLKAIKYSIYIARSAICLYPRGGLSPARMDTAPSMFRSKQSKDDCHTIRRRGGARTGLLRVLIFTRVCRPILTAVSILYVSPMLALAQEQGAPDVPSIPIAPAIGELPRDLSPWG